MRRPNPPVRDTFQCLPGPTTVEPHRTHIAIRLSGMPKDSKHQTLQPVERQAGRMLLLDPDDRLLLLACRSSETAEVWWITPGGGLEPGETHAQAAVRETLEETGINVGQPPALGPAVWRRSHRFPWLGQQLHQHEQFFVSRVEHQPISPHAHTPDEQQYLCGHRWWSHHDIAQAHRQGTLFSPHQLPTLLRDLLRHPPRITRDISA